MILQLAPKQITNKRGKKNINYVQLSLAYNTSMHDTFESDPSKLCNLGLRLKSPAHIKDFFDRVDKGLAIGTALSSRKDKFIELRAMLRDESSSAALPAMRLDPHDQARTSSSGLDLGTMSDSEFEDRDDGFQGSDYNDQFSDQGAKSSLRARKCCRQCLAQGRGNWHVKRRGAHKWVCSNTICSRYLPDENFTAPPKQTAGKLRAKRMCKSCKDSRRGDFEMKQTGKGVTFALSCSNHGCDEI
jgi:hypothetical protein